MRKRRKRSRIDAIERTLARQRARWCLTLRQNSRTM
jgi:hypothetical protein